MSWDLDTLTDNLERKKPKYFIDCSKSQYCNFAHGALKNFLTLKKIVDKYYKYIGDYNGISLYEIKKRF